MIKPISSAFMACACLLAFPVAAATPGPASVASAPVASSDVPEPAVSGVIRIGDHTCPAVPENTLSDKTRKTLALVSATCVMEASGLITHDEAQSVYEQALGNIQVALSEIQTEDAAPALAGR